MPLRAPGANAINAATPQFRSARNVVFACLALLALAGALFVYSDAIAFTRQLDQTLGRGRNTLRLAVSALAGHLKRYEALPELLSDKFLVQSLLTDQDSPRLRESTNR
ncbi:MAG: hypothetical protein ACTHJ3_00300, partial [Pararhizobium sp.]